MPQFYKVKVEATCCFLSIIIIKDEIIISYKNVAINL
jgi:hypothetical protein